MNDEYIAEHYLFKVQMKSRELGQCMVCCDAAVGINFGVPTCAPCKAFFRRNAVKLGRTDFVCQLDGNCPITNKYRRSCNCCRLAKCFRVGMQKSLILSDGEREARKELIQQNRQKRTQIPLNQNSSLIRSAIVPYVSQERSKLLSSSDQTLLTNIFDAYGQTSGAIIDCPDRRMPTTEHSTLHEFANEYEIRIKMLVEYFKIIPEFSILTLNDKTRLVKNHFIAMSNINDRIISATLDSNRRSSIKNTFSTTLANNLIHISERLVMYTYDPIMLKLILLVQSLSSGNNRYCYDADGDHTYDDTRAIFAGQNVYVEILWRYIIYRLPSQSDAVRFFSKLMLDLLFLQRCGFAVDCYFHNLDNEIDKLEPLMQSMWPRSMNGDDINGNDSDVELHE